MKHIKPFILFAGLGVISLTPFSVEAMSGGSFTAMRSDNQSSMLIKASDDLSAGAENFVRDMTSRGIGFLKNASLSEDEKKNQFRSLLHSNFDMKTIGRFSLGRYWNKASAAEKKEYQKLFEDMIVEVYSRRFGDYDGQELEVRSSRKDSDTDVTVQSFILPPNGGQEVQVDWRVRKKNGSYKVIDVIVEGVSMGVTQRSDFASVIQRGGGEVSVLIAHLNNE